MGSDDWSFTLGSPANLIPLYQPEMMTTPIKRSNASAFSSVKSKSIVVPALPKAPRKRVAKEQLEIVPADKETVQAMKKLKTTSSTPNPSVKTSFCGVFHEKDKWGRLMFFVPEETHHANVNLIDTNFGDGVRTPFQYDDAYWKMYTVKGKLAKDYNVVLPAKGNSCVITGALELFSDAT